METARSFRTLVPAVESHMALTSSCRILVPTVESGTCNRVSHGAYRFLQNIGTYSSVSVFLNFIVQDFDVSW